MKHISYSQYTDMQQALLEHIDKLKTPYEYLYLMINGYPSGTQRPKEITRKLLSMTKIKKMWNSPRIYRDLVKLVILCHYKGNIVNMSENSSSIISQDVIDNLIRKIKTKIQGRYNYMINCKK